MSCSSVASQSFAKLTTGMVQVMPWFPLPELLITAIGQPPILASQAAEVQEIMCASGVSPKNFCPEVRMMRPKEWPYGFSYASEAAALFSSIALVMKPIRSRGVSMAKS